MFDAAPNSDLVELALAGKFQDVADLSASDVNQFSEEQRFRAIHHIQDVVLTRSPAPKDDPSKPVCEERFAAEIAAMVRLSETMRHTSVYKSWLEACRAMLVYNLYHDATYMRFAKKWDKGDVSLRKGTHRARERLHTRAANKTFLPIFKSTKFDWFSLPRREDPIPARRIVLNGSSKSNIKTGTRRIELNTHPDSSFSDLIESNATGHHEKVHDLGFQLGYHYACGDVEALGGQAYDAMLWYYLKKEKAVISPRIRRPYKAQFHEVVAFSEGNKMKAIVRDLLKPGFEPQKPFVG